MPIESRIRRLVDVALLIAKDVGVLYVCVSSSALSLQDSDTEDNVRKRPLSLCFCPLSI